MEKEIKLIAIKNSVAKLGEWVFRNKLDISPWAKNKNSSLDFHYLRKDKVGYIPRLFFDFKSGSRIIRYCYTFKPVVVNSYNTKFIFCLAPVRIEFPNLRETDIWNLYNKYLKKLHVYENLFLARSQAL